MRGCCCCAVCVAVVVDVGVGVAVVNDEARGEVDGEEDTLSIDDDAVKERMRE